VTAVATRSAALVLAAQAVAFLAGCGGDEQEATPPSRSRCVAPAGVSDRPVTVEQTVALVNALPKPLTLSCFIEALGRPLHMHSSQSQLSAQPASGPRSPRVFLFVGANIMTVVPDGIGAHLLELGEQRANFRSLKAEIAFPVTAPITPEMPFEHVMFNERLTSCAFCHAEEEADPSVSYTKAFVSRALRPAARLRVPLDGLRKEHELCQPLNEPERCALLDALFGWGPTEEQEFPPAMPTFD
jgi:hypothetical protein